MKQPEPITFTLGDEPQVYTLQFDFNALCDAEEVAGCNLMRAVIGGAEFTATKARALLFAFLKTAHPKVTLAEAGELFSKDQGVVLTALIKVLNGVWRAEESEPAEPIKETQTAQHMADDDIVHGLRDVEVFLDEAPGVIADAAYGKALQSGIDVFAEALATSTPVRKGALRNALATEVEVDPNGGGGIARVGFGALSHRALFVEYGHLQVGHRPGKKPEGSVPAHPFMRPAFDGKSEAAVDAVAESLNSSVQEEYRQDTD